jgi:peptide chain release factor 2
MDASFWDEQSTAQTVMRRLAELRGIIETWHGLLAQCHDLQELVTLALDEEDGDLEATLQSEVAALNRRLSHLEFELRLSGPYDDRTAILAVHAGAGGTESQDWAQMLLRMYIRWAEQTGRTAEILDEMPGEEAGIKSATIEIAGPHAYGYLKGEAGVHRLVRLSPFDAAHARHTSFALVEVMPETDSSAEVNINPEDLRVDVYRASGHGGQNVQKNSTAIRVTHIPSGIVVTCQNERSQHRNREIAMRVLTARLLEKEVEKMAEEQAKIKGEHIAAGWGNQIRSYVLHPYKLVKDHRSGFETSDTVGILDGDLDDLMKAYLESKVGVA